MRSQCALSEPQARKRENLQFVDLSRLQFTSDESEFIPMSKIEICFFTARILQNQRILCCGECFHD
jgi:hypothetical protein